MYSHSFQNHFRYDLGSSCTPLHGASASGSGFSIILFDLHFINYENRLGCSYIDHGMCKSIFFQQARRSLGLALHRRWVRPNSCPTAAGTSFSIPTNPAPWRPRRPMRTTRRHISSTITPTPLAMGVGPERELLVLGFPASC